MLLSARAIEILGDMEEVRISAFVFPGSKRDAPLSNIALAMTLRRPGINVTGHGSRLDFPRLGERAHELSGDVAEIALARVISDKTEAAYRRGDLFEKRRALMDAWAAFCTSTKEGLKVVALSTTQPVAL